MSILREQMQLLANEIARTRKERTEFILRTRENCLEMRSEVSKMRKKIKTDLTQKASSLSRHLYEFNRSNQRSVAGNLRTLRAERIQSARRQNSLRKMDVARNRNEIARTLSQSGAERKRSQREIKRACLSTLRSIKLRVQSIRIETQKMTRSFTKNRSGASLVQVSPIRRVISPVGKTRSSDAHLDSLRASVNAASAVPFVRPTSLVGLASSANSFDFPRPSTLPVPPTR